MSFTYADAINAGLKTELMTVVVQPAPPIIPTVLSGNYKLGTTVDGNGEFNGYAFEVTQNYLNANSISGIFSDTEEFLKFAKDLKDSGATLQLDGIVGTYTAQQAIDDKLIFDVREGNTTIEGSFEISEGVIKISQNTFTFADGSQGAFSSADELISFVEKCFADLKEFDQVQRMWMRRKSRHLAQFSPIKFLKFIR